MIAPLSSGSSHYFAATCFLLSGLIMGVLLAGSIAVSIVLFVALLAGGCVGFYLSRGHK